MNKQHDEQEAIDPSRSHTREERPEDRRDMGVIDPLRAPARDLHETWRSDATKTPGQLMAEEGIDRKEATRRVRWARRQQKRMDEMVAVVEDLNAKRLARKTAAGRTPLLETKTSSTDTTPEEATK